MIAAIDPLSKFAIALIWIAGLSVCQRPAAFLFLIATLLGLLVLIEKTPLRRLAFALAPFAFFALTSSWTYAIAPNQMYDMARATGWSAAALVGLRTITIGLVSISFAFTTEPADLARALVARCALPRRFVYGALAAIQFLPALAEEARMARMTARAALSSAIPDPSPGARLRLAFAGFEPAVAVTLLAGAVRRASAAAIAMELRGLGVSSAAPVWRTPRFRRRDAVFCLVAMGLFATAWIMG